LRACGFIVMMGTVLGNNHFWLDADFLDLKKR